MPEGHIIHRAARLHEEAFGGRRVRAWSPQGRFAAGAGRLDGQVLAGVEAAGKHLFYRWEAGDCLHVHLGLIGKFALFDRDAPAPSPQTRLALAADTAALYLTGPAVCELIDPDEEMRIRDGLGPDPLDPDADPGRFATALARRSTPIGQALLDQSVVAGIGNAFRAEALFIAGICPKRPSSELSEAEVDRLWQLLVELLEAGERSGEVATLPASERGSLGPEERGVYVYRRGDHPCRRCGTTLRAWKLAGRTITACPTCQPT